MSAEIKQGVFASSDYQKNDPVYLDAKIYDHPKESYKQIVSLISSACGNKPISLVDVGCASGGFISHAKSRLNLSHCTGIDISDALLAQARQHLPDVEWLVDSILEPSALNGRQFDVCTCIGTVSIFDDLHPALTNLFSLVKKAGLLYIFDLINDDPVDVLMRYRIMQPEGASEWQPGFNVRSLASYEQFLKRLDSGVLIKLFDFELSARIEKTANPMRAWTLQTEQKRTQLVVGTGQLLNFKILEIRKP